MSPIIQAMRAIIQAIIQAKRAIIQAIIQSIRPTLMEMNWHDSF